MVPKDQGPGVNLEDAQVLVELFAANGALTHCLV